jgi:hypothetical protein
MRGHSSLSRIALVAVALACAGHEAATQGVDTYPTRVIDRPPTLARGGTRLDLQLLGSRQPGVPAGWLMIVGGGVGAWRALEAGGQVVPITLAPGRVAVADPSLYAAYGLNALRGTLVPTVQVVVPLADADPFYVDAGAQYVYTFGQGAFITFTPTFSVNTRADGAGTSFTAPLGFTRQVRDRVTWQLASGVGLSRFEPRSGLSRRREAEEFDDLTVPLSVGATYTIPRRERRHALGDLTLQLSWPQLYTRAPALRGSHVDDWTIQLLTSWYSVF